MITRLPSGQLVAYDVIEPTARRASSWASALGRLCRERNETAHREGDQGEYAIVALVIPKDDAARARQMLALLGGRSGA